MLQVYFIWYVYLILHILTIYDIWHKLWINDPMTQKCCRVAMTCAGEANGKQLRKSGHWRWQGRPPSSLKRTERDTVIIKTALCLLKFISWSLTNFLWSHIRILSCSTVSCDKKQMITICGKTFVAGDEVLQCGYAMYSFKRLPLHRVEQLERMFSKLYLDIIKFCMWHRRGLPQKRSFCKWILSGWAEFNKIWYHQNWRISVASHSYCSHAQCLRENYKTETGTCEIQGASGQTVPLSNDSQGLGITMRRRNIASYGRGDSGLFCGWDSRRNTCCFKRTPWWSESQQKLI